MKKTLFSLMLFFFTVQFAQAQQFNQSLLKSYSKTELVKIKQENPNQIKVLNMQFLMHVIILISLKVKMLIIQ